MLNLVYVRDHEINVQDNEGETPLHEACYRGHSYILEILMLAGADETITNDNGKTPAQVVNREHKELLKLLDRVGLWHAMQERQKKLKLSQTLLTLRLMRKRRIKYCINPYRLQKLKKSEKDEFVSEVVDCKTDEEEDRGKWRHILAKIFSIMLTTRNIILNLLKLKRKTNCIL